jgi:hypothetical protein
VERRANNNAHHAGKSCHDEVLHEQSHPVVEAEPGREISA